MKKQKTKITKVSAAKEARALASALPETGEAQVTANAADGRVLVSANSVWNIKLVHTLADLENPATAFHPEFTHVFFDDDEEIEGYESVLIETFFLAASCFPYVRIEAKVAAGYHTKQQAQAAEAIRRNSRILKSLPSKKAALLRVCTDLEGILAEYLPPRYTNNLDQFIERLAQERTFVPPGTKAYECPRDDGTSLEIYWGNLSEPAIRDYHALVRIFSLWTIDGAQYFDDDDSRWEVYFLFERDDRIRDESRSKYTSVGYCTVYRFFAPPQHIRLRISQFLMYPPFQKRGYGRVLLNGIYQHCYSRPEITEVPVEDPSPQFQRLRDMVDLLSIYSDGSFTPDMVGDTIPTEVMDAIQRKRKLWRGQIRRCYEIHRLRFTPVDDHEAFANYRLWIKKRIFKEHFGSQIWRVADSNDDASGEEEAVKRKQEIDRVWQEDLAEYRALLLKLQLSL